MRVETVMEPSERHGSDRSPPQRATALGGGSPTGPVRERRDAELAREGWVRRFIGGPPRLREMTELYESLGHEVLLDPLKPGELDTECGECVLALQLFRVVYTRRRS